MTVVGRGNVPLQLRTGLPAEHAAPDVLYLLGWEQAVQPREDRNLGPDQVRRPQALRRDDPLPHGIGKGIGVLEREVVCDRGGAIEEMPTVLLPQRFGDQRPLVCSGLRSRLGHRGRDATGFEVGDLDAERRQLHTEVLGEGLERRLRRRVRGGHGNGHVHRSRRGVDDPTLDWRSSGVIACTTCTGPQKLTSNARRYSVMDAASMTPSRGEYPALLIKRSSVPPVWPPTVLAAATTRSGAVTPHGTAMTCRIPNQRVRVGRAVPIRREHLPTFALESHDK